MTTTDPLGARQRHQGTPQPPSPGSSDAGMESFLDDIFGSDHQPNEQLAGPRRAPRLPVAMQPADERPDRPPRRSRRRARRHAQEVGLDALLGFSPDQDIPVRAARARAISGGLVATGLTAAFVLALLAPFVIGVSATVREASAYYMALPSKLPTQPIPTRSRILAADGTVIATFFSENRVNVTSEQIAPIMKKAILAIEDSRFYSHDGVDLRGTGRAFVNNLLGGPTQGGSTITQQYVKNVLATAADTQAEKDEVTSRTSYLRKLREAKLAIHLEQTMTKDEILVAYLNVAYFGDGAYGIGTAAQHFFSKPADELTLPEAALLAGLVKNPVGYDPTNHPRDARERRDIVLRRMLELGDISPEAHQRAVESKVKLRLSSPKNGCVSSRYPFFCTWIRDILQSDPAFGRTAAARNAFLYRGGLTIRTTIDPEAQAIAQTAVDEQMGRNNRVAASAVTIEPGTGYVVAMAVNRTFGTSKPGQFDKTQIVLPITPAFQPGSNFKPITLAAAIERGFDPDTQISAPATYSPPGLASPPGGFENASSSGTGTFDAATAMARSSNTWFVRLEEQVGVLNVAAMAERLGITSLPRTGPRAITSRDAALTLGAYEVSPMELAGVYATFAAEGVHCDPTPIISVEAPLPDGSRGLVDVPSADCHEAITPGVADTVANIMAKVVDGPDPLRTGADQSIGRPAAGKTGTTQNNAAVWFSGFTPQYATSVAVMDPRGGFAYPLQNFYAGGQFIPRAYGSIVAGPIWERIMRGIHQGLPIKRFPTAAPGAATASLVPDVRGLTIDRAAALLRTAGFEVELADKTAPKSTVLVADVVAYTEPQAATYLGPGSTVRLVMTDGSDLEVRLPSP